MSKDRKTMGSLEALWAVLGGLFLASLVGRFAEAWIVLTVVVVYFAAGALYWKVRLAQQRREQRERRQPT